MFNFRIHFVYPWLLLLFIPGLILGLLPYFKIAKRYRRTRNRIISVVLHVLVLVFSISALAGMTFSYETPNDQNQIILLVDVSDTEEQVAEERDKLIKTIIQDASFDEYQLGIVTFGYDQEYAVPLTRDLDLVYDDYKLAAKPDVTATNLADALTYTKDLFTNPQTAKIVLITDGKETDKEAKNVIRSIVAQGIKVDTAYVGSSYVGSDIQLCGIKLPDYHVGVQEECQIILTVQSKTAVKEATINLFDNNKKHDEFGSQKVELIAGEQTIVFKHVFADSGLHELKFSVEEVMGMSANNAYSTEYLLEIYNKVLILEREQNASNALVQMLNETENSDEEKPYEITVKNVYTSDTLPKSADELRQYDQVILNNISDADIKQIKNQKASNPNIPENFDLMLEEYVSVYGGGLFTVGGNDEDGEVNAYNRRDLYNTTLQRMMPVQAIDYTPPLGVIIIIDRSGSMDGKLEWAKAGAAECLSVLDDRDYIGIMTLDTYNATILELTPRTQEAKIRAALNSLETTSGGTVFSGAIQRAGLALRALKSVDKRHIIIVSDGQVGGDSDYESLVSNFYKEDNITLSFVGVNIDSAAEKNMRYLAETLGGGKFYKAENADLMDKMYEDLSTGTVAEVNMVDFKPIIRDQLSPLFKNVPRGTDENANRMTVNLGGFYGVKVRDTADLLLAGEYDVPIYAQWKYGKGTVGSFMCDLSGGEWSDEFMTHESKSGQNFIKNVVNNLMPTEDIRKKDITVRLKEDNYTNQLSVYTTLGEGEYVKGEIVNVSKANSPVVSLNEKTAVDALTLRETPYYVTSELSETNYYSRCSFVARESGTYKLTFRKYNAQDQQIGKDIVVYKTLSYSEEYDVFTNYNEDAKLLMEYLAKNGNGKEIANLENPEEVFADFVTSIKHTYDPRFLFMILSIVLFLLDIAVRKFKFKWIHEIIRDRKIKKNLK